MQRIKVVFISHLHGDHYYGLPGFLNSLHLLGREAPLKIYSPPGLKEIFILLTKAANGRLGYPIEFIDLDPKSFGKEKREIYSDAELHVEAFLLKHRIPCFGYLFKEQTKELSYLPKEGEKRGVKVADISNLKRGQDIALENGDILDHKLVTSPSLDPRSYAFCTDTLPLDSTSEHVKNSTFLYHEATFLEADRVRSKETYHSTAKQAATVAKNAKVDTLVLGHYSARYKSLEDHLKESKEIFENSVLAVEGDELEFTWPVFVRNDS